MESSSLALVVAVVAATSLVFSMLGLGGGLIYVPLFYLLGLDLKTEALPLSLALTASTQLSAAIAYQRRGLVRWELVGPLALGMLLTAAPAVWLTLWATERAVLWGFCGLLAGAALSLLVRPANEHDRPLRQPLALGLGAGAGAGLTAGLLGVGGGVVMVPALMLAGVAEKRAIATAAVGIVLASGLALLGHLGSAAWHWSWAGLALVPLVTSQLGARLMVRRLSPRVLRAAFALVLLAIAGYLLARGV